MNIQQVAGKSLVKISSDNNIIYGTHHALINDLELISFSYKDIIPLQIAEKNIERSVFNYLIKSCENITKNDLIPELVNYVNAERLKVYLKETDKYYIVISFGEYQPTLYRIYIEGIFEKTFSNLF